MRLDGRPLVSHSGAAAVPDSEQKRDPGVWAVTFEATSGRKVSAEKEWRGTMQDSEAIVVGGGPVGLCTALLLAEAGIAVVLLEANVGPSDDPRGSTFHPPTLDMLQRVDVTRDLLAEGLICPTWQTRLHPTGARAVFDLECLKEETDHPFRLQCEQWRLSRILRARLAKKAQIVFGAAVIDVTQNDEGVLVTIEQTFWRTVRIACICALSRLIASAGWH